MCSSMHVLCPSVVQWAKDMHIKASISPLTLPDREGSINNHHKNLYAEGAKCVIYNRHCQCLCSIYCC